MKKKKVLFLGGTGRIGPGILEEYLKHYKKYYEIILGVHKKGNKNFKTVKIDLTNLNSLKKAMKGVDVVVNFAANSSESAKFEELLIPNIVGAYNVFKAACETKVKRVIFASSVHAVKGYNHKHEVHSKDSPKPLNLYGASKAYGESLCYLYSQKGLSCLAIRIGAYVSNDEKKTICYTRTDYGHVISQRDLGQLIHKSIMAPEKIKYGILNGISNDKHRHLDLKFTKKLIGYKPKDDAYKVCKAIKKSGLKV
jgi:nucleoside-diphosphate-sugar epimerase